MSARLQSRRPSKRRAVEGTCSQGKVVLDVDLNAYPDEIPASSWFSLEASDTAVSLPYQAAATQRGAAQQGTAPIDVDAIDDDVVLLSSSRGTTRVQNLPSRSTPVVVVLDEDLDAARASSGGQAEDSITILSHNYNWFERNLFTRDFINCEAYVNLDSNQISETELVISSPEPHEVAPKEPTFSCAVCLGELVDETSTTCGHVFCQECIKTAIRTQKKCPTCRTSLNMKKIHRIYLPTTH